MKDKIVSSFYTVLFPYVHGIKNSIKRQEKGNTLKITMLTILGLIFWLGIFAAFYFVLKYFAGIEIFGPVLAKKLLSMVFLTFFTVLIFSNTITALSTYFLSEDLQLILSAPVSLSKIYGVKFLETLVNSSWMVVLFALPVFLAYGAIYRVGVVYFLQLVGVMGAFLVIPATIGIILTMVLVLVFPARRTKDILFIMGLTFFVILLVMFRMLRPERLVDPDVFKGLLEYIAAVEAPTSAFMPTYWATEALSPFLFTQETGSPIFYVLMLWSTALALVVVGNWVSEAIFFKGWSKAQESKEIHLSHLHRVDWLIFKLPSNISSAWRGIIVKDIKMFFRDTAQWSQLLLLLALVVVYVYNFSVLPLDRYQLPTFLMQNIVSFLNLALAGFVLSAVAVRFVFPSVSLEGKAFWIVKSAPISIKSFLWSKFWVSVIPLLVIAEGLTVVTNYFLHVTTFMMVLSVVTIFFMTIGITSMGVGIGAIYPRFSVENPAKISTGFGGIVYMVISMIYIGAVVAAEAHPTYVYFWAQLRNVPVDPSIWIHAGLILVALVIINIVAIWLPMRLGTKNLEMMEI